MTSAKHIALITGAAGLIGKALVGRFTQSGYHVVAACRRPEQVPGADDVTPIGVDLADPGSVAKLFADLEKKSLVPRTLVANASSRDALAASFAKCSHEDFSDLLDVDVSGHFLCAREMVHRLRKGQTASIVLLSSVYAEVGVDPGIYVEGDEGTPIQYAATKAAVLGVTRFLAAKWGRQGVRVNAIVAGGVENGQDPRFIANYARKTMLGRMAQPEEIAAAALFLASDDASYITGAAMAVDGGFTAW